MVNFGRVCGAEVVGSNLINRPFADFFFFYYIYTCNVLMSVVLFDVSLGKCKYLLLMVI